MIGRARYPSMRRGSPKQVRPVQDGFEMSGCRAGDFPGINDLGRLSDRYMAEMVPPSKGTFLGLRGRNMTLPLASDP
jgi:hypothetical protein